MRTGHFEAGVVDWGMAGHPLVSLGVPMCVPSDLCRWNHDCFTTHSGTAGLQTVVNIHQITCSHDRGWVHTVFGDREVSKGIDRWLVEQRIKQGCFEGHRDWHRAHQ